MGMAGNYEMAFSPFQKYQSILQCCECENKWVKCITKFTIIIVVIIIISECGF